MANYIKGVDVSSWHHQGNFGIDWEEVYAAGYSFALVKATQGTGYVNPWAVKDISDANAAGLLVGAYHYYEAGEDAVTQAKWAMSNLVMQNLDLGCYLDWEAYLPTPYTHTQDLVQFLAEARLTRPQTGLRCSDDWAAVLEKESVHLGRLWVSVREDRAIPACFISQGHHHSPVPGITGEVATCHIANVRSIDIPTAPPPPPTAEHLYSLEEAEAMENTAAAFEDREGEDADR